MMAYSDTLLDHFQSPRNFGDMEEPDAEGEAENPVCGDRLRLQLRIVDDVITEVRWRGTGCPPAIATASAGSELLLGKSVKDARALTQTDLDTAVDGLPPRKAHAALLILQTLERALNQLTP